MSYLELYYATNRRHKGDDRWEPASYGIDFSSDTMENLRFGKVTVKADDQEIQKYLNADVPFGKGNGNGLKNYLSEQAKSGMSTSI